MIFNRKKKDSWIDDLQKKYPGIRIVTPQDKINLLMGGIQQLQGKGFHFQEASQWMAIGNEYMTMGDLLYAKRAYQAGLEAIEKVEPDKEKLSLDKESFEGWVAGVRTELKEKLENIS